MEKKTQMERRWCVYVLVGARGRRIRVDTRGIDAAIIGIDSIYLCVVIVVAVCGV